jgi:hypothetical protein
MARTLLGELGWNPEALERQLSHVEPGVSGVYNKSKQLRERRKIMQEWADYLDALKTGSGAPQVAEVRELRGRPSAQSQSSLYLAVRMPRMSCASIPPSTLANLVFGQ